MVGNFISDPTIRTTMTRVDLSKMDPMARKMEDAIKAFHKAIEDGDTNSANDCLKVIKNTSSFLSEDLWSIVQKAEMAPTGPNNLYAGGVPVMQFAETAQVFDVGDRDRMVKGLIMPARTGGVMQPQRSPGQRV
tara:strand:- start:17956 stop:18357 length:402 start_codon:yes stop_codon:yes gene_type:complete